jgi:hypothetical protein
MGGFYHARQLRQDRVVRSHKTEEFDPSTETRRVACVNSLVLDLENKTVAVRGGRVLAAQLLHTKFKNGPPLLDCCEARLRESKAQMVFHCSEYLPALFDDGGGDEAVVIRQL